MVPSAFGYFDNINVVKTLDVTEHVTLLHAEVVKYQVAVSCYLISAQLVKVRHVASLDGQEVLVFIVPHKNLLPLPPHVE